MEINFYNRKQAKIEQEKVYGDKAIEWLYNSQSGKFLSNLLIHKPFSAFYGFWQNTPMSASKVSDFTKNFNIKMEEYLPEEGRDELNPYSSFNQFFIRRFKGGARPFPTEKNEMGAFAEARYFGYDKMTEDKTIPVKGKYLTAKALLNDDELAAEFEDGPLLLARLCPVDYHRYHYPDNGKLQKIYRVKGKYHSVNPVALKAQADIFASNERVVSILETENFGKLAYVEVGAMCVGKIIQSHEGTEFLRGEEKGYFLFGGSTVIVLGQAGKWKPSQDILDHTKNGMETYIQLGDELARTK